jgi:hypothetical protein
MAILSLLVLASAAMSLPTLGKAITPDDYPEWALKEETSAMAEVNALIAPDGHVVRVEVLRVLGNERLAAQLVNVVKARKHMPPTGPDGAPAFGLVHGPVSIFIPETALGQSILAQRQFKADFLLPAKRLPDGQAEDDIKLLLAVDKDGRVTDCVRDPKEIDVDLAKTACEAKASMRRPVVLGEDGAPLAYVTGVKVKMILTK